MHKIAYTSLNWKQLERDVGKTITPNNLTCLTAVVQVRVN